MSFRVRIEADPETWEEFELAWTQRLAAGRELLTLKSDQNTIAEGIYLLGYVAEMILKIAYFRFYKPEMGSNINSRLIPTRTRAEKEKIAVPDESFHSLIFWLTMLLHERKQEKRPFKKNMPFNEEQLRRRVDRLYQNWWVDMRYHAQTATFQEGIDVLEDVTWLAKHQLNLWR